MVTTDNSDWATNCPEFKVTAVQVSPSNGPSEWQEEYRAHAELARRMQAVGNYSKLQRAREQAFAADAVAQVASLKV